MITSKNCPKCDITKPISEFYKSKDTKSGFRCYCKNCERKQNQLREPKYRLARKKYRTLNAEKIKAAKKKYYSENKAKIDSYNKNYSQKTFMGRLGSYKNGAKLRDLTWDISDEEFKSFWKKPCSYCGVEIETIGLDRLDSSKGYFLENVTSCSTKCNRMKLNLSDFEFLKHVSKIYEFKNNKL